MALLFLIIPLKWILAAIFAAFFHELSHILTLLILNETIQEIQISDHGACILTGELSPKREVLAAIAGPTSSFLLYFLSKRYPCIAYCGLIHAVYNLLPYYPLDGGRVVRCIIYSIFRDETAKSAYFSIELLFTFLVITVSIFLRLGILPVIILFTSLYYCNKEKFLAKKGI